MVEFEDKVEEIRTFIVSRKAKWQHVLPNHMDFDDVSQIILAHVYKKWPLWDQTKPFENWVNTVITHQILNITRNNSCPSLKPCASCPYNLGSGKCRKTDSGYQSDECNLFFAWSELNNKNRTHGIPDHDHHSEASESYASTMDYERSMEIIIEELSKELSPRYLEAFKMMFLEGKSDDEVAKYLNFRTRGSNKKAVYAQLANLRKKFKEKVKKIIKEQLC